MKVKGPRSPRRHLANRLVALISAGLLLGACMPAVAEREDAFLEELSHRSFLFFWEQANPRTGLVADRARADGSGSPPRVASIASVGFGLSGMCAAAEHGWLDRTQIVERVRTTLRFLHDDMPHERGFYYHFVDVDTGERTDSCELSTIDTALLMAGVLTAREYFDDGEIRELATKLFDRVEWPWMLNEAGTLSMGWTPEAGHLAARWDGYSEHMLLYLMGLGSSTHPLPQDTWYAWKREPVGTYAGMTYLQCPPLFTHQYSQAWIDFRERRDAVADYWLNSVLATRAQRLMCIDLRRAFPLYGETLWGLTSSDGPDGYKGWGGPPPTICPPIDGAVVPCAPGGSLPFLPGECLAALRSMKERYGERIWKKYGFADAFNPHTGWVSTDVIGIDVGITLLMVENRRSGLIWETFMKNREIQRAMRRAGFVSTANHPPPKAVEYLETLARDTWRCIATLVHPMTGLPYDNSNKAENTSVSNIGLYLTDVAAAHAMGFIDAEEAERRIDLTLTSVEKLKTWHGFQQSWNAVETLEPGEGDTWVSILDSGNLAAGLLTVGQAFPQFGRRCRALVDAMDWAAFYDPERQALLGGYDRARDWFNPGWTLPFLAADSRLASFLAIASGKVPAESWDRLDRSTEERHHARFFKPGWEAGGLFMPFINGLWLDESGTVMEQSAANFAYAQIRHAEVNGLSAWGWSACESPEGGYLGWGKLQDDVVTPHACALAIRHFPQVVIGNLRALEWMGARHETLGFYDSVNIRTGKRAETFLLLDQSMLFLSLVNHLRDDVVRDWFQSNPGIRRGRQMIRDYREARPGRSTSVFNLGLSTPDPHRDHKREAVAVFADSGSAPDWQLMDVGSCAEFPGLVRTGTVLSARFACTWDHEALNFTMDVQDEHVENTRTPDLLHEQDCVELFVDPKDDGLLWGSAEDFQFGFAVENKCGEWFGGRKLEQCAVRCTDEGYRIEARIPWTLLGVEPSDGMVLGISPAVKSVGPSRGDSVKMNWSWNTDAALVRLGRLVLKGTP